jgi:hypothetical protein
MNVRVLCACLGAWVHWASESLYLSLSLSLSLSRAADRLLRTRAQCNARNPNKRINTDRHWLRCANPVPTFPDISNPSRPVASPLGDTVALPRSLPTITNPFHSYICPSTRFHQPAYTNPLSSTRFHQPASTNPLTSSRALCLCVGWALWTLGPCLSMDRSRCLTKPTSLGIRHRRRRRAYVCLVAVLGLICIYEAITMVAV